MIPQQRRLYSQRRSHPLARRYRSAQPALSRGGSKRPLPEWDSTIHDLSIHRLTAEQVVRFANLDMFLRHAVDPAHIRVVKFKCGIHSFIEDASAANLQVHRKISAVSPHNPMAKYELVKRLGMPEDEVYC